MFVPNSSQQCRIDGVLRSALHSVYCSSYPHQKPLTLALRPTAKGIMSFMWAHYVVVHKQTAGISISILVRGHNIVKLIFNKKTELGSLICVQKVCECIWISLQTGHPAHIQHNCMHAGALNAQTGSLYFLCYNGTQICAPTGCKREGCPHDRYPAPVH